MLPKRFNSGDVEVWQIAANEETGGNLSLWMELKLNEAAKKYRTPPKLPVTAKRSAGKKK